MYKLQWLPEYNRWGLRYFNEETLVGYQGCVHEGYVHGELMWTEEEIAEILLTHRQSKSFPQPKEIEHALHK